MSLEDSALRNTSTQAPESAPAQTWSPQEAGGGCVRLTPESHGQPPKTQPGREGASTDAAGECGGTRRASFPPQEHAPSPRLPPLRLPVLQSVTACVNAKGQSGCPATLAPMSTPQPRSSACGQHRLFPSRWAPLETAEPGNVEMGSWCRRDTHNRPHCPLSPKDRHQPAWPCHTDAIGSAWHLPCHLNSSDASRARLCQSGGLTPPGSTMLRKQQGEVAQGCALRKVGPVPIGLKPLPHTPQPAEGQE